MYLRSTLYTQYNGEYFGFDIIVEEFLLNLKKCNLEPIFIFDGLHELSKLNTILRRSTDRIITLSHLQENSTRGPIRDGTSADFRVSIEPILVSKTFFRTLERFGARYVVADFEADQLAAAMAMHLGVPLISNDSDYFILGPYWANRGCELIYVPAESCDFLTPHESNGGFYISAEQYIATETVTFRNLAPIQIPLFAVLSGNDYVPPNYFHAYLPGATQQQQAYATSNNAARTASRFRRLIEWLSGFGNDIVDPVDRILSKFPKSERPRAFNFICAGFASYHVPFEELPPYMSFIFGDDVPPSKVAQSPPVLTDLSDKSYGLQALHVLAAGEPSPRYLSVWPPRLLRAFRNGHVLIAACDAIFAFGIVLKGVVEDYQSREPFHLCSLPLRRILVGLLFDAYPSNTFRLPGIFRHNGNLSYKEYRREGCTVMNCKFVNFDRISLKGFPNGFAFLQHHFYLPERPSIIPKWLHGVACVLFLWTRFDARPDTENLATSSVGLAVSLCAVGVQMRLLQNGAIIDVRGRNSVNRQLLSISSRNIAGGRIEPLRFAYLHIIAQIESVFIFLTALIDVIDALMPEGAGCEMELLPPQIMFPSGCLAHHIACKLSNAQPKNRMREAMETWLPQLLGRVEPQFLEQIKSTFSGLIRFVDSWTASIPSAEFRTRRRVPPPSISDHRPGQSRQPDNRLRGDAMKPRKEGDLEAAVERRMRETGLID
nr:expressed conserved protein [Hymenolepis microstoma]